MNSTHGLSEYYQSIMNIKQLRDLKNKITMGNSL